MIDDIVDNHNLDSYTDKGYGYVIISIEREKSKLTTKGWELLFKWKDGNKSWVTLNYINDFNPIEVKYYDTWYGIGNETTFAWWNPFMIKKHDIIIFAVNVRLRKKSHKYGIEIPKSVQNA